MKITALKSGKFAHPEPSKPQINVREGKEYDVDDTMWESMVDSGWGEPVEVSADKPLNKMKKDELIAYAEVNEIDLDPTLTNADMVVAITWAEANSELGLTCTRVMWATSRAKMCAVLHAFRNAAVSTTVCVVQSRGMICR